MARQEGAGHPDCGLLKPPPASKGGRRLERVGRPAKILTKKTGRPCALPPEPPKTGARAARSRRRKAAPASAVKIFLTGFQTRSRPFSTRLAQYANAVASGARYPACESSAFN